MAILEKDAQQQIGTQGEKIKQLQARQDRADNLLIGIAIVVGLGFLGLLFQYFTATQTTFQNMINQINQQNTTVQVLSGKIDSLTNEIYRQKDVSAPVGK